MTRKELAARAGVSVRTIWSVENGSSCRVETKRRILRALGVARRDHGRVFQAITAREIFPPSLVQGDGQESTAKR
jgi:predicted transcriptional regulator